MRNIGFTMAMLLLAFQTFAQSGNFYSSDPSESLTACNCNSGFNQLNVEVEVPSFALSHDIVGVSAIIDGEEVAYASWWASEMAAELGANGTLTLNMMNPEKEGYRNFIGKEFGLFQGDNINTDFRRICMNEPGKKNLKVAVYVIDKVGEEISYNVEDLGTKYRINRNVRDIFSKAKRVNETDPIVVQQMDSSFGEDNVDRGLLYGSWAIFIGVVGTAIFGGGLF